MTKNTNSLGTLIYWWWMTLATRNNQQQNHHFSRPWRAWMEATFKFSWFCHHVARVEALRQGGAARHRTAWCRSPTARCRSLTASNCAVPFIQAPRSSMPFSRTGPWESIGRTPENCNCGTNFYRPYGISKLDSLTKSSFFESFALCRHLIISCKKSIIQSNDRNIAATTTTTHKTSSPSSSPFLSFPFLHCCNSATWQ